MVCPKCWTPVAEAVAESEVGVVYTAFMLYRSHLATFIKFAALFVVPAQVLATLIRRLGPDEIDVVAPELVPQPLPSDDHVEHVGVARPGRHEVQTDPLPPCARKPHARFERGVAGPGPLTPAAADVPCWR